MGTFKYTRAQVQAVIALCEKGLPLKEISERLDVEYSFVWKMVCGKYYSDLRCESYEKFQGTPQIKKLTNEEALQIRTLHHEEEVGLSALARKFDVDYSIIVQVLKGVSYADAGGKLGIVAYDPYPDDLVQDVRQRYANGEATHEIISALGDRLTAKATKKRQVYYMLKKDYWPDVALPPVDLVTHKRDPRKMSIPPEKREIIRQYYLCSNATMQQIADAYGVDISYISKIVNKKR